MIKKLLIPLLLFLSGCFFIPATVYDKDQHGLTPGRKLVVWLLSDIQPESREGRAVFENAVQDVNDHIPDVTLAVIAGDLLKSRSRSEAFDWFLAVRERSYIRNWYEIAGNHDVRSGEIFWDYIKKPPQYGVRVGNILLLLISDESTASKMDISDETFSWWRQSVIVNQDNIVITITHAPLRHSGLFSSFLASRRIEGSPRFEEVLQKYRVALWGSGHSHLPQGMFGTISIRPDLGGTCFINVSAIREDSFMDSQSRFLIFTEGSEFVWIRSRNHSKNRFDPGLDVRFKLDKPFVWDGVAPEMLLSRER